MRDLSSTYMQRERSFCAQPDWPAHRPAGITLSSSLIMEPLTEAEYDRLIEEETERANNRSRSPRLGATFPESDEGRWLELQHHGWCIIQYGQLWRPVQFKWPYRTRWQPAWWKLITL